MLEYALRPTILQEFKADLRGEVICPNDHGYDAARKVWNGMIDKYPALIVRCTDVVDAVHAVQFARDQHLLVAVRSGGHSVSGSSVCNEGMLIDLSPMKGIWVRERRRRSGLKLVSHWASLCKRLKLMDLPRPPAPWAGPGWRA